MELPNEVLRAERIAQWAVTGGRWDPDDYIMLLARALLWLLNQLHMAKPDDANDK